MTEPGTTEGSAFAPNERLGALMSLEGRSALVTGAAAGIGRSIARRMAEAGAELVLVDRDRDRLEAVASELRAFDGAATTHVVDLGHPDEIDGLWTRLADAPPDILVNNAGMYPGRGLAAVEEAFYRRVMAVNLDSVFWMCRHMIRQRMGRGGIIVNISSIEAILPFKADLAAYSTGKAGVIALTRALAHEHARHGFRINVVVPGGIATPGTRSVARGVLQGRLGLLKTGYDFRQRVPAGRLGRPDDVARVVLFLASGLASYVHGAVVPVDGGFLST